MAGGKERRSAERYQTASIPVQLSEVNGELIDLSLNGAAVIHRSPVRSGAPCTLVFPTHGGFYIPCTVLRSVVQVRRSETASEYVFRSAIRFSPIPPEQEALFTEFLEMQMRALDEKRKAAGEFVEE